MAAFLHLNPQKICLHFGKVCHYSLHTQTDLSINLGGVPYDGFPDERIHQTPLPIVIIYSIMATVGLIFAITCLVFNVVFRQKR